MQFVNRKMQNLLRGSSSRRFLFFILSVIFCAFSASAQSTDQSFPTPVLTNEITGRIAARDIGDARLTTYFYVFGGTQGDIFVNVKTANLDGDIDVFAFENLRPLTKITVFSDASTSETGRVIYLRKPEKLILRVQGRSPNDNAATFNLKFAGSFAPAAAVADQAPELPKVKAENQSDLIVNSVGTIIGVKPKPTPAPKETVAENQLPENKPAKTSRETESGKTEDAENRANRETKPKRASKTRNKIESSKKPVVAEIESADVENETAASGKTAKALPANRRTKKRAAGNAAAGAANEAKKTVESNPLENVLLVILFKDGTKIERAMSEVLRVGVDKGVLTLITKDGKIARFSILDVSKMTIE